MKSCPMFKVMCLIMFAFLLSHCASEQGVVKKPPAEMPSVVRLPAIEKISLVEGGNYSRVLVEGSDPMALPFYKLLRDPLRIAIDIPDVDLKQVKSPLKVDNGTISDISATQYEGKGRIEIGLVQMTNYNIGREDRVLTIDVEKVTPVVEVKESPKEEAPVQVAEVILEPVKKEEATALPPPPPPAKKAKEVTDIRWEDKKDSVVFNILADGVVENYNTLQLDGPPRLVLDLWSVGSRYPQRSVALKSPFVQKMRLGRYPDKLRVVFDSAKPELPAYQVSRIELSEVGSPTGQEGRVRSGCWGRLNKTKHLPGC